MVRAPFASLAVLACVWLIACTGDPVHPPPPPGLDGSIEMGCAPLCRRDGGPRDLGGPSDDGGRGDASVDGGLTGFCEPFPRAGSSATLPSGFAPTRIVARWNTEACALPELIVALTEGGCDLTDGERFELHFNEANVTDGSIMLGLNTLFAGVSSPLRMRYVRVDPPSATYGPCAVGAVTINMLDLRASGRFSANFDVTLDDCALAGDAGVNLMGSIDVPVLQSSGDACP